MFSGIVEKLGSIVSIKEDGTNLDFEIKADFVSELYIDQSISHNGVCLTVVKIKEESYIVTAIEESIKLTNLGKLKVGDPVNLERCMKAEMRLDGHLVQGHVDIVGSLVSIESIDGSWYFRFEYPEEFIHLVVSKGSIAVNGISLTVVDPKDNQFSVAIIPYTYEYTNFHHLEVGDLINLEFDIIGKYVAKHMEAWHK